MSAPAQHGERLVGMPRFSWPLTVGFIALAIPAVIALASETWSSEEGGHGPLVLATAAWLMWRQFPEIQRRAVRGRNGVVAAALTMSLVMYIFGEAFDFITLEAAGLYCAGLTLFYAVFGAGEILRNWFIFFYLLFAVPPPRSWLDHVTSPLKQLVSSAAAAILQPFGIPVTHQGAVIYVAQYQYLVENACSGLNSIVGLLAISLFYIYLSRGSSWRYSLILAALTIPIAIAANILRIMILILLSVFAGDAVAQGFMHFAAGIVVFIIALALIFALDAGLTKVMARRERTA